ncbi:MAG: NAD-dependent protein deacetylase of SIR2 family [Candidatus Riflebacteria bacterium]|nr:NAD-dependent protein deacetylase of SIR2 family [Candidatus Riflebacteria bacterium]
MSQNGLNPRTDLAVKYLKEADALLIGAGAGLSAAAGFDFTDRTVFAKNYPGMLQYGFKCKLDMMGNFSVPQELLWGYYLQHVRETRFIKGENKTYQDLLALAQSRKNYFVITTNADGLFERNNFDQERIFTPQGDYKLAQCLTPCSQDTWAVEPIIEQYLPLVNKATQRLSPNKDPKCPNCGGPTFLNVRGGAWFVEKPWLEGSLRFHKWLTQNGRAKIAVLEVGSGFNTPMWVRWPSEKIVRVNPNARLLRINLHHPEVPEDIAHHSLSFAEPANEILSLLAAGCE